MIGTFLSDFTSRLDNAAEYVRPEALRILLDSLRPDAWSKDVSTIFSAVSLCYFAEKINLPSVAETFGVGETTLMENYKVKEKDILEGRKECIRMLLRAGFDINAENEDGETVLYRAEADNRPHYFLDFLDECGAKMPEWYDQIHSFVQESMEDQQEPGIEPSDDNPAEE